MPNKTKYSALVLSGGGVKGTAMVGALQKLWPRINPQASHVVGVSIGALIAYLLVLGYTPDELLDVLNGINLNAMHDVDLELLIERLGMDDFSKFRALIQDLTKRKTGHPSITFAQLHQLHPNSKLEIVVSNLSQHRAEFWSHVSTPTRSITDALHASMCFPIAFVPWVCPETGDYYIDGGAFAPFPFRAIRRSKKKIGIFLGGIPSNSRTDFTNIHLGEYIMKIMAMTYQKYTEAEYEHYSRHCCKIDLSDVEAMDMDITPETKEAMRFAGWRAMSAFLGEKLD